MLLACSFYVSVDERKKYSSFSLLLKLTYLLRRYSRRQTLRSQDEISSHYSSAKRVDLDIDG